MKSPLVVPLLALLVALPIQQKASQSNQRVPITPVQGEAEKIQFNGVGVPSGYMILGETETAPPGYTVTGIIGKADAWISRGAVSPVFEHFAAAATGGKIYAMGGDGSGLSPIMEYDPATDAWTPRANTLQTHARGAAAAVDGKVYAIGGSVGMEAFDPIANTWTVKAGPQVARDELAACECNGKIYALGGAWGSALNTVEEYDPAANTWTLKAPMPTARWNLGAASVNGKVYAIGGSSGCGIAVTTVEEYDPANDSWRAVAPLRAAHSALGATTLDGRIYAIGVFDPHEPYFGEKYDPSTDTWTTTADLSHQGTHAVTAGGKVYAVGDRVSQYDPVVLYAFKKR